MKVLLHVPNHSSSAFFVALLLPRVSSQAPRSMALPLCRSMTTILSGSSHRACMPHHPSFPLLYPLKQKQLLLAFSSADDALHQLATVFSGVSRLFADAKLFEEYVIKIERRVTDSNSWEHLACTTRDMGTARS